MTTSSCSIVLAIVTLLSASEPGAIQRSAGGDELKAALCYPGTGMRCVSAQQAAGLAAAVDELMRARSGNQQTLADFIDVMRALRVTGAYRNLRVFPGRRTLREVCRELGALAVLQQRLAREGRREEISGVLSRIRAARSSGASEAEVQRLVRDALRQDDLMVRSCRAGCRVQRRLDLLAYQLVAGEQVVGSQARFRGVAPAEFLVQSTRSRERVLAVSVR